MKAMKSLEGKVRACAAGEPVKGMATVEIGVRGETGRVSRVRVTGIQGPVGSCIALVVRKLKFDPFKKPTFSINYPYKLQ